MKLTLVSTIVAGLASLSSASALATGTQARNASFDLDPEAWANLKAQKPTSSLWAISNDKGTVSPYWRQLNGSVPDGISVRDYVNIDGTTAASSGLVSRDGAPPDQVDFYTGNYCTNYAASLRNPSYNGCYSRSTYPTQWNSMWFSSSGTTGTLAVLYSGGRCSVNEDVLYEFSGCATTPGDPITGLYFYDCLQSCGTSS